MKNVLIAFLAIAIILSGSYFLKTNYVSNSKLNDTEIYIPPNCEKVEVFVAGGDIVDWCSLSEDETKVKNTCFRRLEEGAQSLVGEVKQSIVLHNVLF